MITQPQRYAYPYELDEDIDTGFRTAVENNQVSLALQYAVLLFARQDKRLFEMEEGMKERAAKATAKPTKSTRTKSKAADSDETE